MNRSVSTVVQVGSLPRLFGATLIQRSLAMTQSRHSRDRMIRNVLDPGHVFVQTSALMVPVYGLMSLAPKSYMVSFFSFTNVYYLHGAVTCVKMDSSE